MLAVYVFALLIAGCWIGESILRKKILWKRTPLDIPIAIFFVSQLVSTIFSINFHTSLFGYYTRFNGGLLSIIAYIFLYYMFVTLVDIKHIKSLLTSLLIGGVLSALYAFPEHFGNSPSCLIFTGKFDVACWVQDVKTRVFGTFGQPNWLAAYLGMLLPLAIVNTKSVEDETKLTDDGQFSRWLPSVARLLVALLFIVVLFFTGSRSGIIAIGVGLALLLSATAFLWFKTKQMPNPKYIGMALKEYLITLGLTLVGAIVITLVVPNPIQEKLTSLFKQTKQQISQPQPTESQLSGGTQLEVGGSESGQIRNIVWKGAFKVWQRYPLFGSGVETFAYSYYKDRPQEHNLLSEWDFLYNKAHNEFLNYLATTGTFGFVAYMFMLGSMVTLPTIFALKIIALREKKWLNQPAKMIHHVFILLSLTVGMIIVSISNFFGFSTVMVSLLTFIFPAIAVTIVSIYSPSSEAAQVKIEEETTASQWIALVLCSAIIIFPLLYIRRMWSADVAYAKGKQFDNFGKFESGFPLLRRATTIIPEEPTYHDEYSYNLAALTVSLAKEGNATQAAEFANEAIKESDQTIKLNKTHVNFWKTRVKVFLTLAQLDTRFYTQAEQALLAARDLSPTDPKLVMYLALLVQTRGENARFLTLIEEAIGLKPNFEEARTHLARYYEEQQDPAGALEQYEYMVKFINPNNQTAKDRIASLSATLR